MKRRLAALALGLALGTPAWAQDQAPNTLPLRGALRVRTAMSQSSNRQWIQKIFPTLESGLFRIEDAHLDWLALADESHRFTSDGWLAYRGAVASFSEARPQLTAIPGFEWTPNTTNTRLLSIYGADHPIRGLSLRPYWPALRVGRLMADFSSDQPVLHIPAEWLRRGRILALADELYYESLAGDLLTGNIYAGSIDTSDLLSLEKPEFLAPSPAANAPAQPAGPLYAPIESIWGRPSSQLSNDLTLSRGTNLARELQDPPGLTRMGLTAKQVEQEPGPANVYLTLLQDTRLRFGDPPGNYVERLPLPPGWRPDKVPEATRENPQYQQIYGEYYALLETGLSLFQNYGGGGLSRSSLEQARLLWSQGTNAQHLAELPPYSMGNWDQVVDWLQRYDPDRTIVTQLNQPNAGGPGTWVRDLDPRKLKDRPLARQRVSLIEVVYGQGAADFSNSTLPTGGEPAPPPQPGASPLVVGVASNSGQVERLRHYYNLALRNGWRVAPCSGIDNLGPLNRHQGLLLPRARYSFTGLYPGSEQAIVSSGQANLGGTASDRIRAVLEGLAQRRTFVSENPYVDALFYARDVTTGRIIVMGGDLFQGSSAPTVFEFTLKLDVPQRNQHNNNLRIKMEDIRLVEVVEREHDLDVAGNRVRIVNVTRGNQTALGEAQMSQLVADEIPILKYYTSGAVAQPGAPAGVSTILQNYGLTGSRLNPPDPETFPLPVTLTWRTTVRPHQPGSTMAYYATARLPQMSGQGGSIITAPLFTVGDWTRFASTDESQ